MTEGNNALQALLEEILKNSPEPLDCNELYDMERVREIAPSANRVSDYLGVMFRRGLVSRVPVDRAEANNRARWKYLWKGRPLPTWRSEVEPLDYAPKVLVDRPNVVISEGGSTICIQLPNLSITIKKN